MNTAVVIHPNVLQRRAHIDELRLELAELCDAYMRLTFVELPALRYRYEELFGEIERRIQSRTLDLRRRRRMVELFALKLDRGQKLDAGMVALVMKAVHNETADLEARVHRSVRVGERVPGRTETATRERAREARELYRRLVRLLHPDARGADDPARRRYWDVVQQAWLRLDVEMLRAVHHIATELGPGAALSPEVLDIEERRLQEAITGERRRLGAFRDIEPYSVREELTSDEWIESRRSSLQAELDAIEAEIEKCDRFLDPIFESVKTNESPAVVKDLWADWVERMYLSGNR